MTKQWTTDSEEAAGAVNHITDDPTQLDLTQLDWESIDWGKEEKNVKRLQARIVKAEQEGRYNKVKAVQYMLTRSRSAKLLALRRVTENKGGRTPGVDQET